MSALTRSNDKLLWALTAGAREAIELLVSKGWDRDLALSILERLFGEDIYELDEDEYL